MQSTPKPRRTTGPSRTALAVATLAAAAALAIPVAITGVGFARGADAASAASAASAAQPAPIAVDPATGEQVVVDTIYVVTADPALLAGASSAGVVEAENDDHGQHEHEAGDD
jgi:hypothetical protein